MDSFKRGPFIAPLLYFTPPPARHSILLECSDTLLAPGPLTIRDLPAIVGKRSGGSSKQPDVLHSFDAIDLVQDLQPSASAKNTTPTGLRPHKLNAIRDAELGSPLQDYNLSDDTTGSYTIFSSRLAPEQCTALLRRCCILADSLTGPCSALLRYTAPVLVEQYLHHSTDTRGSVEDVMHHPPLRIYVTLRIPHFQPISACAAPSMRSIVAFAIAAEENACGFNPPDSIRLRVLRLITLPHARRRGHGSRLLRCLFTDAALSPVPRCDDDRSGLSPVPRCDDDRSGPKSPTTSALPCSASCFRANAAPRSSASAVVEVTFDTLGAWDEVRWYRDAQSPASEDIVEASGEQNPAAEAPFPCAQESYSTEPCLPSACFVRDLAAEHSAWSKLLERILVSGLILPFGNSVPGNMAEQPAALWSSLLRQCAVPKDLPLSRSVSHRMSSLDVYRISSAARGDTSALPSTVGAVPSSFFVPGEGLESLPFGSLCSLDETTVAAVASCLRISPRLAVRLIVMAVALHSETLSESIASASATDNLASPEAGFIYNTTSPLMSPSQCSILDAAAFQFSASVLIRRHMLAESPAHFTVTLRKSLVVPTLDVRGHSMFFNCNTAT